jgi:hypothetical protein
MGLLDIKTQVCCSTLSHFLLLPEADFTPSAEKPDRKQTCFKKPHTKIRKTGKLEAIHEWHFVEQKKKGRKPDKNSIMRRLEFVPKNLD